jgi:hypothetical protein
MRVKRNLNGLDHIPEVNGWPELHHFLAIVNATESPVESVGCEKAYSPAEVQDGPTTKLGSYVDVIFTDLSLNDRVENSLLLASHLLQAVQGCERWWADVSFVLQRCRGVPGTTSPWGLMLHVTGYGRSEEEARKSWGQTIGRLGKAIVDLPKEFRFDKIMN